MIFFALCPRRVGIVLSLFLLTQVCVIKAQQRMIRVNDKPAIIVSASQCHARTINYITHSLPQTCLMSVWPNSASISVVTSSTVRQHIASNAVSVTATEEMSPSRTLIPSAFISDETNGDPVATPFMSFEDWKEMMLRRAGQDPQELRQRKPSELRITDRAPLEFGDSGLGEEGEISLVFDDYHGRDEGGARTGANVENRNMGNALDPAGLSDDGKAMHHSKDAGKTCKERFSYSSFDAGATILKTGQGTKNAKAILVENQDSYMLLECAAPNKYVIVELSDDILIDTIVIANFEFFSSMIRHISISVSDRYPVKMEKWRDLGIFEARNSRDIQPFLVQNPQIWAKYVRLEFLTHYGNEYFCPVSLLRVHGSRMLDSWKDSEISHEEALRDEETVPSPFPNSHLAAATPFPNLDKIGNNLSEFVTSSRLWSNPFSQDVFYQLNATCAVPFTWPDAPWSEGVETMISEHIYMSQRLSPSDMREGIMMNSSPISPKTDSVVIRESPLTAPKRDSAILSQDNRQAVSVESPDAGAGAGGPVTDTSIAATKAANPIAMGGKRNGWTASATSSPPIVQEGFFNAITKRLQQVESNLTLSLKYVEDQSRHIQEVLQKAEHKQLTKLTVFLGELNQTVLAELRKVQDQYDQIWQSTVLALESQRDQSEREIMALSTRLNVLADEVVFQKRMAIVQAILLLSCLFLVIFSRGVSLSHLSPQREQNDIASYAGLSPSFTETRRLFKANSAMTRKEQSHALKNRHFAVDDGYDNVHLAMELSGFCETSHRDDGSSHSITPGSAKDGISNDSHLSIRDIQAGSSRRPTAQIHNSSRKPLPSLPEHPISGNHC